MTAACTTGAAHRWHDPERVGRRHATIMEILRHTQISQTRRYVKGRSHLSKEAMRRMGEFLVPPPATSDAAATPGAGSPPEQAVRLSYGRSAGRCCCARHHQARCTPAFHRSPGRSASTPGCRSPHTHAACPPGPACQCQSRTTSPRPPSPPGQQPPPPPCRRNCPWVPRPTGAASTAYSGHITPAAHEAAHYREAEPPATTPVVSRLPRCDGV